MAYSRFNIIYRLQKWMDSVAGQTFLNYAYSWGASIVILGTLFKLTHLPGADFFLFLGMGTEVLVFFISAFDRPFDKTADGMSLATSSAASGQSIVSIPGSIPFPITEEIKALTSHIGILCDKIDCLRDRLPCDISTEEIRKTLDSIHDTYKQQLVILLEETPAINRIKDQAKIQAKYLEQLNLIYARMIKAVGGTVNPEHSVEV